MNRLLAILILALAALAPYLPGIVEGHSPFLNSWGDASPRFQFFPWTQYTMLQMRQGYFGLWFAPSGLGAPHLANFQSNVFAPFHLAYYLTGRLALLDLMVPLRLFAMSLGMFLLLERVGMRRIPALWGAFALFSAGFFHRYAGMVYLHGALWVPWMLWAWVGFGRNRSAIRFLAATVFLALFTVSGHPETTLYLGLWALLWMWAVPIQGLDARARTLLILAVVGIAGLVAAPLLLPFFEYLPRATHYHGPGLGYAAFDLAAHFPRLILPVRDPGGVMPADVPSYLGLLVIVPAAIPMLHPHRMRPLAVFNALVALLAAGALFDLPLLGAWRMLPPFDRMLNTVHLEPLLAFSLAVAGAGGLDALRRRVALRGITLVCELAALILAIALWRWTAREGMHWATAGTIGAGAIGILILFQTGRRGRMRVWHGLAYLFCTVLAWVADADIERRPPLRAAAEVIDQPWYRWHPERPATARTLLAEPLAIPYLGALMRREELNGSDPLQPMRFFRFAAALQNREPEQLRQNFFRSFSLGLNLKGRVPQWIDRLNVAYLVTRTQPVPWHNLYGERPWDPLEARPEPVWATPPTIRTLRLERPGIVQTNAVTMGGQPYARGAWWSIYRDERPIPEWIVYRDPAHNPADRRPQAWHFEQNATPDHPLDLRFSIVRDDGRSRADARYGWSRTRLFPEPPARYPRLRRLTQDIPSVWQNLDVEPRWTLHPRWSVVDDARTALERLAISGSAQPPVLLGAPPQRFDPDDSDRTCGSLRVIEHHAENLRLWRTGGNRPCLLLAAQLDFPGWRAWVDGVERRIYPADYALQGLPLTERDGRIRIAYRPWSFAVGLWSALCGLAAMALLYSRTVRRRR